MESLPDLRWLVTEPSSDYGEDTETLAFVSGALATVLVSTVGRGEQRAWMLAAGLILMLALVLGGLRVVLPRKESGLVISILAWIALPLAAIFCTMLRQNRQAAREDK